MKLQASPPIPIMTPEVPGSRRLCWSTADGGPSAKFTVDALKAKGTQAVCIWAPRRTDREKQRGRGAYTLTHTCKDPRTHSRTHTHTYTETTYKQRRTQPRAHMRHGYQRRQKYVHKDMHIFTRTRTHSRTDSQTHTHTHLLLCG